MLLGIQYFATSPSRRLTTHITGIRETNLASCAIYQPSHINQVIPSIRIYIPNKPIQNVELFHVELMRVIRTV